jgi:hypothetical protein
LRISEKQFRRLCVQKKFGRQLERAVLARLGRVESTAADRNEDTPMRWWVPVAVSALLLGAGATRVGSRRLMATIRSRRLSCPLLAAEPPAERQFDGHPVVSPATLLHPHTDFAQRYWTTLLKAGDTVIDATVGNGHDAAVLVEALGRAGGGTLLCLDAQAVALERSQERLRGVLAEWELREGADEWLAVQRSSGAELVIRWVEGWTRT